MVVDPQPLKRVALSPEATPIDSGDSAGLVLLRHQLSAVVHQQQRPRLRPADRAFMAALARLLPYRSGTDSW